MAEQQQLPLGNLSSHQFEPVPGVAEGAQRYAASRGLQVSHEGLGTMQADPTYQHRVAQSYGRSAGANLERPGIRASYGAMRDEVNAQYEHMTKPVEQGGLGIQHEVTEDDPYRTPQAMASDVGAGKIKTLSTAVTGGHAFFTDQENDRFRAVHDVFGHAAIGRGFSRHGEEAAFHAHAQMFSPKALPALASETRGQNSVLNYGPGEFPDQTKKLVGVPEFAQRNRLPGQTSRIGRGIFRASGQPARR